MPAAHTLRLGSPFDYATQVTVYLEVALPEPSNPAFLPAACGRIAHYLRQSGGGAFVLFTSYAMLIEAANRLKPDVDAMGFPLLVQGSRRRGRCCWNRFRSRPNSVLFGTGAFWQGIDVQGEALRNVIIVKLPFSVPDEPVTEARLEAITAGGGNAFMQYSVPEAVIKLKQGFGRLIRSRTDTGIVAILDSRVKTKRYGRLFLDAPAGVPGGGGGVRSWELGVGSWELGVGSWELGVFWSELPLSTPNSPFLRYSAGHGGRTACSATGSDGGSRPC